MHFSSSNGLDSKSSFPLSTLEKSRISFMIDNSESPLHLIVSKLLRCSGFSSVSRMRSAKPIMAFMGVRISWLILARKSDFALAADSAISFAFLSSSSVCFLEIASPIEAAAAIRIETSTPAQLRSEWQSSKAMNPQNSPFIMIGKRIIDLMFLISNASLSESGNSRANPLIGRPWDRRSQIRENFG